MKRVGSGPPVDLQTIFIDAIFKYRGLSIAMEFADKKGVTENGLEYKDLLEQMVDANGRSFYTGKGFNIQMGYLFKSNWEIAGRYTTVTPDWEMSFTGAKEYTLGLSKFIVGHNLKVQSDVSITDQENKDVNKLRYRLQFEFQF